MIITTGTITVVDGATLPLVYSDSTGDHVESTISNLVAGSRVQIYNTTTSTEVVNEVVAGTSLNYYHIQTGASYRVRATQKGYLPFEGNAVSGGSGFSVLANQLVDSLYNQFNTDGETITEFAWDGVNLEVDVTDADNETIIQRIAAWAAYFVTTEVGIRDFFGGITWEFYNQVRNNSSIADVLVDNKKPEALLLAGGKFYRTDGQSIISPNTTGPIHVVGGVGSAQGSGSASIALDYDEGLTLTARVYTMAGATQGALVTLTDNGSGLYTGTFSLTGVPDGQYIVRFLQGSIKVGSGSLFVRGENEVSQEDFFNPNFDIVQSVSATTTNLDAITLTQFNAEVDTALADYDAPTKAELDAAQVAIIAAVDANEVKIDLLETKTQADARQVILVAEHDATQATLAGLNNLSLAQVEASTILAKEATVNTRLASASYTAPDNASITAIKVKTDNLPAVPASQGDVTALNNLSLAQVEASTVLAKEATTGAIKAKTDNLPADPADQSLLEAAIAAIPSAPSAASIADEVRVELAPELARIDVSTSTRATPANITDAVTSIKGADNKDLTQVFDNSPTIDLTTVTDAIAALNDLSLAEIEASTVLAKEATVNTRLASASYTAPDNAGITGIKAKTDLLSFTGTDVNATLDGEQVVASNMVSLSGIATTANINNAVTNLKGADDKDLTQVFNNIPSIDLTPVTDAISSLNDFNPTTDIVARVTLVDTCTTNTDMRGTNGAITSLSGIATSANVTSAQSAIIAEVNANEVKIDATLAQATLARKHVANRDKINTTANTLTRYDDDGVTPIRIFDLKDDAGNSSSASIFEKVPQ